MYFFIFHIFYVQFYVSSKFTNVSILVNCLLTRSRSFVQDLAQLVDLIDLFERSSRLSKEIVPPRYEFDLTLLR